MACLLRHSQGPVTAFLTNGISNLVFQLLLAVPLLLYDKRRFAFFTFLGELAPHPFSAWPRKSTRFALQPKVLVPNWFRSSLFADAENKPLRGNWIRSAHF